MLPQVNAQLLSISRGGFSEDYDRPSQTSPYVWQGNLDAYIQQRIKSAFNSSGTLVRVLEITLFISSDLPVTVEPGDILVYQAGSADNLSTLAGVAQSFIDPAYLPMLEDYYKVALEPANVP